MFFVFLIVLFLLSNLELSLCVCNGVNTLLNPRFDEDPSTSVQKRVVPFGWSNDIGSVFLDNSTYDTFPNSARFLPSPSSDYPGYWLASLSQSVNFNNVGERILLQFALKIENLTLPTTYSCYYRLNDGIMLPDNDIGLITTISNGVTSNGFYIEHTSIPIEFSSSNNNQTLTLYFYSESPSVYYLDSIEICGSYSSVVGDPIFSTISGHQFQIHGSPGYIYNLVSTRELQFNSRFEFLSQGQCPTLPGDQQNCFSHPGTYLTELGIMVYYNQSVHKIKIVAGAFDMGFRLVTMDNVSISSNQMFKASNGFFIHYQNPYMIIIQTRQFLFRIYNSDNFVNQQFSIRVPQRSLVSHGLLGCTNSGKKYQNNRIPYIEGEVDDYVIEDNKLFGTRFIYNLFEHDD